MTKRRVDLNTPILPDPQMFAWIEANGVDPGTVLAAQVATIEDGKLTFLEFVRDDSGAKILNSEDTGFVKRERTVPLISPPEDHGVRTF
jgi:hypothetical protein